MVVIRRNFSNWSTNGRQLVFTRPDSNNIENNSAIWIGRNWSQVVRKLSGIGRNFSSICRSWSKNVENGRKWLNVVDKNDEHGSKLVESWSRSKVGRNLLSMGRQSNVVEKLSKMIGRVLSNMGRN